jgi:uncharacterized membrane protein
MEERRMTVRVETIEAPMSQPGSSEAASGESGVDVTEMGSEVAGATRVGHAMIVARFDDPRAAWTARRGLKAAAGRREVAIRRVVTVTADEAGAIHIQELSDDTVWPAVRLGAIAGLATGLVLARPVFSLMLAFGTAAGFAGMLRSEVLKTQLGWTLLGLVRPNEAGLVAIVRASDVAGVKDAMRDATSVEATDIGDVDSRHLPRAARRGT